MIFNSKTGGGQAYPLASNVAIAAGAGTPEIGPVQAGTYIWDASFTGTGPLKLQALGADGKTWRDVASLSASGTLAGEIQAGQGAKVRVFCANALTAVSSVLS